jgi:Tol biopolymer transport system component
MTELQWRRAKEITADAFEHEPPARWGFVERACGNDAEVKREVLRLLAQDESTGIDFLSTPVLNLRHFLDPEPAWTQCFSPGEEVAGRFRIEKFLNRGAMGEVYAAIDLELEEAVALKTISPAIAASPAAIERFKREVKDSRRITDTCVCRVFDLFSHARPQGEPVWFLTMRLLDGESLADALGKRGALPMRQALPLIRDMAGALAAAHDLGIVHRDFKPGNIMLVSDGQRERAVATDFGLALNVADDQGGASAAEGTPAYMAPEQIAGARVSFAADQYALGLIICELLAGSRPVLDRFSESLSRQQLKEWLSKQSRRRLGATARTVVKRCLEFQPQARYAHVAQIVPELEGVRRRVRLRWAAAAAAAIPLLFVTATLLTRNAGPQVRDAVQITPESGLSGGAQISRDGKWIVYSSNRAQPGNMDIWIQPAAGGAPRRLTTNPSEDDDPAISPDGKLVVFRSERNGGGLYAVGSDGSGEHLLAPGGWSPVFSPDGRWIAYWLGTRDDAAPSAELYLISPDGREKRRLAADFADARYPTWDPTGKFLLFDGCRANVTALSTCTDWWVIAADGTGARNTGALAPLRSQKIELATPPYRSWHRDEIVFGATRDRIRALWALRLSRDGSRAIGSPRTLTPGEAGEREPSIAANGTVVFSRVTSAIHLWEVPLKRDTGPRRITDDPDLDGCPGVSSDGRWLFFSRNIRGIRQIVLREMTGGGESVIFESAENKFWPVASPDGGRVVFEERRDTDSSIWMVSRKDRQAKKLCSGCSHPTGWFGDRSVLYTTAAGEIASVDTGTGKSRLILSPEPGMVLGEADWNAANQHILFTARKEGTGRQVFAVPFPPKAEKPAARWIQLTRETEELDHPHWSADGGNVYFLSRRDASNCLWGLPFRPGREASGRPFPVMHFHDLRFSPDRSSPNVRGLTVSQDSIVLSAGEVTDTLWLGRLDESSIYSLLRWLPF